MRLPIVTALLLLLVGCTGPVPDPRRTRTPAPLLKPPAPMLAPTAIPEPASTPRAEPWRPLPLPTVTPEERVSAGDSRLYLTAFQNDYVSVVDPVSGHALHQISVEADQAGMAVSPDGARLYIVDGVPAAEGQLRVFDTATWEVVHREPVPDRLRLLGGNPIALSPDGRWLLVGLFDPERRVGWERVFDTERLHFLPDRAWPLVDCHLSPLRLVGQPVAHTVYVQCHDFLAALDADDLSPRWRAPGPHLSQRDSLGWQVGGQGALALSPDGRRLYGLYPLNRRISAGTRVPVIETDLRLLVWDTDEGRLVRDFVMSEQASVPVGSSNGGDEAHLAFSPGGERLFALWHDMLWTLHPVSLTVKDVLKLPMPISGVALGVDGQELYLLTAPIGNLPEWRANGMLTVDTAGMELTRQVADWPRIGSPILFSAPSPRDN